MKPSVDPVVEIWLGSLRLTNNTVRSYRAGVGYFSRWLAPQGISLLQVQADDLHRFSLYEHQRGLRGPTIDSRFGAVRNFYKWLHADGRISGNPAENFRSRFGMKNTLTEVLSLKDLRSLLAAAEGPRERSVLLLMLLHGMSADDISRCSVTDVLRDDAGWRLRMPTGDVAPLPDLVAEPLERAIGSRSRGPLILNGAERRLTAGNVRLMTRKCGSRANLGVDVSPQVVLASMRDILINEPMSMVSILQALGVGAVTNLKARVQLAPASPQHMAFRMALLLRPDADSNMAYFDHADRLSAHHGLPLSAGVTLAGAAFERHLRDLAIREGAIPATIKKTTLGFLSTRLRDEEVITEAEWRDCGIIAGTRDDAAHGWFQRVTPDKAERAVQLMRTLVGNHPL